MDKVRCPSCQVLVDAPPYGTLTCYGGVLLLPAHEGVEMVESKRCGGCGEWISDHWGHDPGCPVEALGAIYKPRDE